MSAIDVIRRVEACGGRLIMDDGQLKVRAKTPLPQDLRAALSEEKAAIMVALGAPLDTVISEVLGDLRPHLPKALKQLTDDRLLVLVNWSIMAAWEKALRTATERRQPTR